MQFEKESFMKTRKAKVVAIILLAFGLLAKVCFAIHLDPYQEATYGREPVIDTSYFGTHFHRLVLNTGEKNLRTIWPASTIGTIRLWDSDTLWSELSTQPGQWNYKRMDEYVDQATIHQATILYTLGGTPRWASVRPDEKCPYGLGCAAEPVKLAHWEEYVRRVAQRYRGRIKAYELWNEPNFSDIARDRGQPGFYMGSVSQMVEMARIARKVLDENDPNAILSTPGFVNGSDRLELFLEAGGKQYIQAIAYHFYSSDSERFAHQVVEVRAIMKRQGIEYLPLWNTETGIEVPSSIINSPVSSAAASRLAQFLILGAASGLEHFYHYAWDNPHTGMLSLDGESSFNLSGYEKVQSWLIGAKMHGCEKIAHQGVLCKGDRAGAQFSIAWSETHEIYVLPSLSGFSIYSIEHFLDKNPNLIKIKNEDKSLRLDLSPEPIFVQYKVTS